MSTILSIFSILGGIALLSWFSPAIRRFGLWPRHWPGAVVLGLSALPAAMIIFGLVRLVFYMDVMG